MEPFPMVQEDPLDEETPNDSTSTLQSDDKRRRATSTSKASRSHRRTISGNVMSRLAQSLRNVADDSPQSSSTPARRRGQSHPDPQRPPETADVQPSSRRRKSSLRKTAMLGQDKSKTEQKPSTASSSGSPPTSPKWSSWLRVDRKDRRAADAVPDAPKFLQANRGLSLAVDAANTRARTSNELLSPDYIPVSARGSPFTSPSTAAYASTTDEDEGIMLPTLSASTNLAVATSSSGLDSTNIKSGHLPSLSPSSSESSASVAVPVTLTHRRSSGRTKSPLAPGVVQLAEFSTSAADDEWDYAVTEWWGWIILLVTWVVFVVGMGSCFEVWSWAWDVGETPYAPPELEDDPTLPIVGYYPALIVLTGVMSWIWVVVAWVGMKYFKHAKMAGEDT